MLELVTEDLDSRSAAAEAIARHRVEHLRVGAERLVLAAQWSDVHPAEVFDKRAKRPGGDGTPEVSEFAADELGALLGIHTCSAYNLMASALDLRHRQPRLWDHVLSGNVFDWVAVKAARAVSAAGLDLAQARWVDEVTADHAATLNPSRFLDLVAAKIIEADPDAAEARAQQQVLEQFVRTGQSDDTGLKTLVARATAGDIIYLVAVIDRIAEILRLQGDDDKVDVRRARALGILASPDQVLALFAWGKGEEPQPVPASAKPKTTMYVHVSQEAIEAGFGVARVEDLGPVTLGQVRDFLKHSCVTVKPVIDLAGGMPVDCWEIPARMRDVVALRSPVEMFPFGTIGARRADIDHSIPYRPPDDGGPPGQTHPDNLDPLGRHHHRTKTHGQGWWHYRLTPSTHLWRTPTGYWLRVDNTGTHQLGRRVSVLEEQLRALLAS